MDEPKTATQIAMEAEADAEYFHWHTRLQNFLKEYQAREDARTVARMANEYFTNDKKTSLQPKTAVLAAWLVLKEARALISKESDEDSS